MIEYNQLDELKVIIEDYALERRELGPTQYAICPSCETVEEGAGTGDWCACAY